MSTAWPPPPAQGGEPTPPGYTGPASTQPPPYPYPYPYSYPYPPPPAQPPWPGPYPPYPPPYPAYSMARSTNGLAIAALVLGIVCVYWVTSILAVIFGHIALSQIRVSGQRGRGLAIAGLVLGYAWLGLLALLIVVVALVRTSVGTG